MTPAITPPKIAIIIGSTRPGRRGEAIARWVYDMASKRDDAQFELIDLLDWPLPHLDEVVPAMHAQYSNEHTKEWGRKIAQYDGFVFVTPEYNHSTSGVLKNAIDFLYAEWNNKAASFVSYGAQGGIRAVEHLRLVMAELQVADVRTQVVADAKTDFDTGSATFNPTELHEAKLEMQLNQLVSWSAALRTVREAA